MPMNENGGSNGSSKQKKEITEADIQVLLRRVGFEEGDARTLSALRRWAERSVQEFSKRFYDRSYALPGFAAMIESRGSTRSALEAAQAAYALDFFRGMPSKEYASRRILIGNLHARICMTPEWYTPSYQFYFDCLYPMVRQQFRFRAKKAERAIAALNKLIVFDQALIMQTYIDGITANLFVLIDQVDETAGRLAQTSSSLATEADKRKDAAEISPGSAGTTAMGRLSASISQIAKGAVEQAAAVENAVRVVTRCRRRRAMSPTTRKMPPRALGRRTKPLEAALTWSAGPPRG